MAKGKSTWKYNKLLTARRNYFDDGGAATAVGGMIGGAIGGGLESGAGNVVSGLANVASAIPGPWGAVAGAGLKVVGGLVNAAFGSKLNRENIAAVEGATARANSMRSNAADFDTLADTMGSTASVANFSDKFIGKDGWFSNKAKKKAAALREEARVANERQDLALLSNAEDISSDTLRNLEANYAAFGGPMDFGGGAIGYDFMNQYLRIKEMAAQDKNNSLGSMPNSFSFGGDLLTHGANFDTGVTHIGNGGTHEENPFEGVPMGMDSEGTPNLVEEGEVIFNDYVFSNRLRVPKEVRKKYKLRGTKPLTFADAAKQMSKESEERPNDPISKAGLEDSMVKLMIAQEQLREKKTGRRYAKGGKLGRKYAGPGDLPQQLVLSDGSIITGDPTDTSWMNSLNIPDDDITKSDWWQNEIVPVATAPIDPSTTTASIGDSTAYPSKEAIPTATARVYAGKTKRKTLEGTNDGLAPTWMRYAPVFASGIMSVTDALGLTNKPDYSEADMVLDAARNSGSYTPVGFSPIGNYLGYTPFDRGFYINQMNAQAGATRRAIMQNAGQNRGAGMAALLASDYNTQGQLGQLARQAEEYNLAQRQKVEEFNRATDMFNTEGALKADMANQEALMKSRDSYLKGTMTAAELKQRERQQSAAARSANLSNFINSLGDIGRENFARNMIISDPSKYYTIGSNGQVTYKNGFDSLSDAEKRQVRGHAAEHGGTSFARGGYLTRRKRRK